MKLYLLSDVTPNSSGSIYRQGRLMGTVSTLMIGGVLVGAPVFWYRAGAPWPVWSLCAAVALLIVPMLIGDLRAKFRNTNWLLWLTPDGVWINFRSYQDQGPTDVPCVVRLEYAEIAQARERVERYTTPSRDYGSTQQKLRCLDFELTHAETAALETALAENRRRPPPVHNYFGIRMSSRPAHFPVSVPAAGCIRLAWRGGQVNWVAPSLKSALRELAQYIPLAQPVQRQRADWQQLSDQELDEHILELIQAGDRIDAIGLLVRRRGYTTTEAKQFVDELNAAV